MNLYYVGLKTGEEITPANPPYSDPITRQIWKMQGPMPTGYALNTLQKLTKAHGTPNVQLFVAVPWHAEVSVASDCTVRFEWPGDREKEEEQDDE